MSSNPPYAALLLHLAALKADVARLTAEVEKLRGELDYRVSEVAVLKHMLVHFPTALPADPLPRFH